MSRVHRALIKAVTEAKERQGLSQQQIADAMGVDKSTVSRILNGEGNLTLKTIGDISWAVGVRPEFMFRPVEADVRPLANHTAMATPMIVQVTVPRAETNRPVELRSEYGQGASRTATTGSQTTRLSAERAHAN